MPKRKPANDGATPQRARRIKTDGAETTTALRNQEAFLQQYAVIGNITTAAKMAGLDRMRHYEWMADPEKWPDYPRRFAEAQEQARDAIRTAVIKRGVYGYDEPVYGTRVHPKTGKSLGTGIVGQKRVFSDRMAEIAAKALLPEFKPQLDVHTTVSGAMTHQHLHIHADVPTEELEARMRQAMGVLGLTPPDAQPVIDVTPAIPQQQLNAAPALSPAETYAQELAQRKANGSNGHS